MTPRRPRRRIEIYFVLYLVALVLLLPDRTADSGLQDVAVISTDLSLELRPERLKMECVLEPDSMGMVRLARLDSTNVIRYDGDLTDVSLRARIEDDRTGQVITIEPGENPSSLFELIPQPSRRAVVFRWRPPMNDVAEHKFRVTILGSGVPRSGDGPNSSDAASLPAGLRVSGSTQFVMETQVERAPTTITLLGTRIDTIVQQTNGGVGDLGVGAFWVAPSTTTIRVAPGSVWTNRLSFGGADPRRDLSGLPSITVDRPGIIVERYMDSVQQAVMLRGPAPTSGSYTVTVRAERTDGEVRDTRFSVEALRVDRPEIPSALYPGVPYAIDPRLPDAPGAVATLRIDDRVIARVTDGEMTFTLTAAHEGKTATLTRTLSSEKMEEPYVIPIRSFPGPEIRDVKAYGDGNTMKVIVLFHGDRTSNRPTLRVVDGNASAPKKLFGELRPADDRSRDAYRWLESFEVRRADASEPFAFTVVAVDQRGRKSKPWTVR